MTVNSTQKPPIWFWIVAIIGLIWNGMGVNHYLQQAYNTESFRNMYTQEQLDIAANTPSWVTAAFAIAVFAGFLGFVYSSKKKNRLFFIAFVAFSSHCSNELHFNEWIR